MSKHHLGVFCHIFPFITRRRESLIGPAFDLVVILSALIFGVAAMVV